MFRSSAREKHAIKNISIVYILTIKNKSLEHFGTVSRGTFCSAGVPLVPQ